MIYQFLFVQWQDYPVLNAVCLNISSHLYSFLSFFSLFCFGTKCKTFCPKWFRLPNKVLKKICANHYCSRCAKINKIDNDRWIWSSYCPQRLFSKWPHLYSHTFLMHPSSISCSFVWSSFLTLIRYGVAFNFMVLHTLRADKNLSALASGMYFQRAVSAKMYYIKM